VSWGLWFLLAAVGGGLVALGFGVENELWYHCAGKELHVKCGTGRGEKTVDSCLRLV